MHKLGRGPALVAAGAVFLMSSGPAQARPPLDPQIQAPRPAPSKIAWAVRDLAADVVAGATRGNALLRVDRAGRIEVAVHGVGPVDAGQEAALRALGARVTARLPRGLVPRAGVVQAAVPATAFEALARLQWTAAITPVGGNETDSHPQNGFVSEGVALHRADDVQTRGIDGTGVDVGVVSDGVTSLASSQAQNELAAVNVLNAGSGDEGTAMLEIVHDMAPGANLLFNERGSGTAGHVTRLQELAGAGAEVITEDIPFDAEPAFQYGLVAQAGDAIAAAGVPVHSSAGNQGQRHAARVTAVGTGGGPDGAAFGVTPSGCANTPDNVVAIAPGGDTTFDVSLGNNASFTLQWSEPRAIFPTAGEGGFTDLNLYVMDAGLTQCLGQSVAVQANGAGDTLEQLAIGGMNGTNAKIVVDVQGVSSAAAPPLIDLRWRGATATDNPTRAGSMNPDANYVGQATTSAAVDAVNGGLENFSSGGPVALTLTTRCPGGTAGPCVGAPGETTGTIPGPTWTAADNVTVSGVGGFGNALPGGGAAFTGTSAAAPHAAACDALLRDEIDQPGAAPATTAARLAATADDMGPVGPDEAWGAGQLDCLDAVNDPPTVDAGGPYTTAEGEDVTLTATGADVDAGDSFTYEWDLDEDGQFDDATGVSATFARVGQDGSYLPEVRVTDTAGATGVDGATVSVTNVAPATTLQGIAPVGEGSPSALSGTVSDAGWLEVLLATIDWGDGAGASPLGGDLENVRPLATLALATTHVFGDNGTFGVELCGADDDTTHCASRDAPVTNIAPTAVIDLSGSQDIGGEPTVLAQAGEPVAFAGRSEDPGSDDLALAWDWDDGAPAPDATAVSLVNAPSMDPAPSPSVQPRDVADERTHAFAEACAYDVGFSAADDDGGTAADTLRVLVVGTETKVRHVGWWHHQMRRNGVTERTEAELLCRLAVVGELSTVFDEARAAATLAQAVDVLRTDKGDGSARAKLDRTLLTVWLDVADGSIAYADAAPVAAAAEAVRLDAGASAGALDDQRRRLQRLLAQA